MQVQQPQLSWLPRGGSNDGFTGLEHEPAGARRHHVPPTPPPPVALPRHLTRPMLPGEVEDARPFPIWTMLPQIFSQFRLNILYLVQAQEHIFHFLLSPTMMIALRQCKCFLFKSSGKSILPFFTDILLVLWTLIS